MLDEATRTAILKLKAAGHGTRAIAKALQVARISVRRVIASGAAVPPPIIRAEFAEPWREAILELYARYEGHLGRVHEDLLARGAALSYQALTARNEDLVAVDAPPQNRAPSVRSLPMRMTQLGAGWTRSPRPVLRGRSAAPQWRSGPLPTRRCSLAGGCEYILYSERGQLPAIHFGSFDSA